MLFRSHAQAFGKLLLSEGELGTEGEKGGGQIGFIRHVCNMCDIANNVNRPTMLTVKPSEAHRSDGYRKSITTRQWRHCQP